MMIGVNTVCRQTYVGWLHIRQIIYCRSVSGFGNYQEKNE